MTVSSAATLNESAQAAVQPGAKRTRANQALAIGTGVGIEIREESLRVALVRVRPSGVEVAGEIEIADFRKRPAKEWGSEYHRFLKTHHEDRAATVLLPRRDVIVRVLPLPGVPPKDRESAIALQMDALHPYGDEDVCFGWAKTRRGGKETPALVGIIRLVTLSDYEQLFADAGIAVASFTFSAAALHAAVRVLHPPPQEFVAYAETASGSFEIYGESESKPVFSSIFKLPVERATALARAELRVSPETPAIPIETLLPPSRTGVPAPSLLFATALAGACRWLPAPVNLLPAERRAVHRRSLIWFTVGIAAVALILAGILIATPAMEERSRLRVLREEIAKFEPAAKRAAALDQNIDHDRARMRVLDEARGRARADLDVLNELTRLLPPAVWTNSIEILPDSVLISGEAEQASPLLKLLDGSPYFQNSEFATSLVKTQTSEIFRIKTLRRARQ